MLRFDEIGGVRRLGWKRLRGIEGSGGSAGGGSASAYGVVGGRGLTGLGE